MHGRDERRAEAVADQIRAAGGRASIVLGDLSTDEGAARVARAALADGPVDILVDNGVSLARDLKGTGVTSNVVSPGAILVHATRELVTSIGLARGWGETWDEIQANAVEALIPNDHGRFGNPDEVAAAVAYLCSDHAEYVSGATIRIDGGLVRAAF